MADAKISDLGDGGLPQGTDEFVVARGTTNNKIAWSSMSAAGGGPAIGASNTTYTSGTVVLTGSGGGVTVRSSAGQQAVISVAAPVAQTVQTQNVVDVTLDGNTSGALALISSGTMTLAGGNNITLSQAGNAITISGPAAAGAQTAISGVGNTETEYTSGSVSLIESGAITIFSTTGQRFVFSVDPQSVQPETQTFIAGVSASNTLYTSGNVRLSGSGAATIKSGTGQLVIVDVPVQSTQVETQTFVGGVSASDTLYTSGSVRFTGVGGGITVGTNTGQRIDLSVAAPVPQTAQTGISGIANSQTTYTSGTVSLSELGAITIRSTTGNQYQFSVAAQSVQPETQTFIGGISASNTLYTSGSVRFTGSQAVTVRSGTGQLVVIDVPAQTAQTFVSGIAGSNTTYTSGVVTITGVGGGVTVSSNTGQRIDISVAAPVAQTNQSGNVYASSNTFGTSSGTYDARTISIAGSGAVSVAASNSGWVISAPAQSVQTQGILSAGVSTGGNTAGNTQVSTGSRLVFVGSNNVTVSQGTAAGATTITISGPATSAQQTGISGIANSQTTYTSGTVSLSELGAITIRSTTGNQFQFSVNSQTNQSAIKGFGASNVGNTAGNTGVSTGVDWVLAGSTNITVSESTAVGGPNTLWLSAPNAGGAGQFSGGASNLGNTAGSTGITGTRLIFVGTNMVSLSQSTDANGGTLSFNATQSAQSAIKGLGVSNTGNTLGNTGISTGQDFIFAASGGLTASESTGAATNTIWFSAPATSSLVGLSGIVISTAGSTITIYQQAMSNLEHNTAAFYSSSTSAMTQSMASVVRMIVREGVSFTRVDIPLWVSLGTSGASNTAAHSISKAMIIGTRNGSTINAITGTSQTELVSWASNSSNYANLTGPRVMSFPLATALTPGEYYIAYYLSTTAFSSVGAANTTNLGGTYAPVFGTQASTATAWGNLGSAQNATSNPINFMQGVQSISISATNQTFQASNITQSGTAGARANQILLFRG